MNGPLLVITDLSAAECASHLPGAVGMPTGTSTAGASNWRHRVLQRLDWQAPALLPLAQVIAARPGHWALATPINLVAGLSAVHVPFGAVLLLQAEEQQLLARDLAASPMGRDIALDFVSPSLALVALPRSLAATTHDPIALAGADPGEFLPSGQDGAELKRLMTELQMWLHDHPLNKQRGQRGWPAVNTLWLWGLSQEAMGDAPLELPILLGRDPAMRALWQRQGGQVGEVPRGLEPWLASAAGSSIAVLEIAALDPDPALAWSMFEEHWLAPLTQGRWRRHVDELEVYCGGQSWTFRAGRIRRGARGLARWLRGKS